MSSSRVLFLRPDPLSSLHFPKKGNFFKGMFGDKILININKLLFIFEVGLGQRFWGQETKTNEILSEKEILIVFFKRLVFNLL